MPERRSYQQTLFDRYGPDAGNYVKAVSYACVAGAFSFPLFIAIGAKLGLRPVPWAFLIILGPIFVVVLGSGATILLMDRAGAGVHKVLTGGASTPYTEQHSYQQALVMQGRLDEALESLEAIIAEPASTVDVRIRAAELYTREAHKHERAAELLREALRHPQCTAGEEAYCANRLVDLLNGPLGQPGRALVELGRLVDRHPNSVVGARAREALRALKALKAEREGFG